MSDLREQARAVAVEAVDRATGYTLEHSSSPELHRHFYDTVEEHVFMALRAAEKRAEDAEEREKQAYEGRKCSEEAAVFEANRLREALAASQALTQRLLEALTVAHDNFICGGQCPRGCKYAALLGQPAELPTHSWFCVTDDHPASQCPAALAESPDHVAPAPEGWKCAARVQGTAGGNYPADCDWPHCGCDPYANKVLSALEEGGLTIIRRRPEAAQEATACPAPEAAGDRTWPIAESSQNRSQPIERCEGRYPVPKTSPPRDEPFEVTYRCAMLPGHDGPHGAAPPEEAAPQAQDRDSE